MYSHITSSLPINLAIILIFYLVSIVATVLLGVWTYKDAKERNMQAGLWTALVLFIPLDIGLIVYLFERVNHPIFACSMCGNNISPNDAMCTQCGVRFKKYCPQCGNICEDVWNVCPRCGNHFSEIQHFPKPVQKKNNYVKKLIFLIISMFLASVLLIVGFFASWLSAFNWNVDEFNSEIPYYFDEWDNYDYYEPLEMTVNNENITVTLQ